MYPLKIIDCGLCDYRDILDLQHELSRQRKDGEIVNTVLIVEHPPVITLGANKPKNKLLKTDSQLKEAQIDTVQIRRGGGATAHNPGQLVFYPIMDLHQLGLAITDYVRELESIGIELLSRLGVTSDRKKGYPGLWVGEDKIASIGVRVSRFITHHGMAINICNDLEIFDNMIPCGIDGVVMTSVEKQIGSKIPLQNAKQILIKVLTQHFSNEDIVEYEKHS
ncbi:MAG: lipoyl(octanoyl) transferase LipB [Phycisphaerae bacterium]|nr:lipoyl(octanoyl) transferase LipB [Phycisphaerae bacterium]